MGINEPYTLSAPTSANYLDNPSHSLQHRETKRFIDDVTPVIYPNSEAVIAAQMFS